MKKILIGLGVVVIIVVGYVWLTYNRLITANENIDNQWAQVETQYQRRFDLIPGLVESVKGAMKQEQVVFSNITEARTRYAGAQGINQKVAAANQVEGALGRLLVVMENYPELKSINTVQTFMAQLEGTENRISVERKRFNDMVRSFNLIVKHIPGKWLASSFGFSERNYFEAAKGS
ncbi:LemA family protein, partial [Candidatus Azambacteria bacterium]|nr:LemA family protein [Candidatus Azambacteria bacterium]